MNTKHSFYYRIQCDPAQRQLKSRTRTNLPLEGLVLHITPVGLGNRGSLDAGSTAVAALEVATTIQPRSLEATLGLEGTDLTLHLESQTNVIKAVDEAVPAEAINLEGGDLVTLGILDLLVDEVDLDLATGVGLGGDLGESGFVGDRDGKHAVLESVVEEDIGEGGGDDALDTEVKKSPGGVLTGATTTEVGASDDQDLGLAVDTLVQDEVRVLLASCRIVAELVEGGDTETSTLDGLQELLGDNGVGVDVGTVKRSGDTLQGSELGETGAAATASGGVGVGLVISGKVEDAVKLILGLRGISLRQRLDDGLDLGDSGARDNMLTNVGKLTNNGSSGRHSGRHQVSAALGTLATLEVTVGGGSATLLRGENIGVHTQTHRATSLTPLEASIGENLVQALSLSLLLDQTRTGNDHGAQNVRSNLLAVDNLGSSAKILNAGVCARSDEDLVHRDLLHGSPRGETHVLKSTLASELAALVLKVIGAGNNSVDRDDILGGSAPGDGRNNILAIEVDLSVELGTGVGLQGRPVVDGLVPLGAAVLGSQRTALEILEGDLIGRDHTSTGTTLNRHVAHGHTSFHAEAANHRSAELNDSAGTTSGSNDTNNVENNVLAGDTGGELAVDLDLHVLASAGKEGLGSENVLDFTGTDTEGEGSEGTVGGGVAVTTNDGSSGQSEALLGTDDVDDTLALVAHTEVGEAEGLDILLEGSTLETRVVLLDEVGSVLEVLAGGGGDVLLEAKKNWLAATPPWIWRLKTYVVDGHQSAVRPADLTAGICQTLKSLRGSHLVDEMAVWG